MMETIKNYLESMFASLPNTPEVIKAKCELGQMMEDKYTELINEGKNENEAVGQVISEFGNLDELGEALGISHILHEQNKTAYNTRQVTEDEAFAYIHDSTFCGIIRGLGVFLAIISSSGVILAGTASGTRYAVIAGLVFLFSAIAACVALCTYSGLRMGRWSFLKYEPCSIDYSTAGMMNDARNRLHDTIILQRTIAVLLLCVCYVPLVVLSMLNTGDEDIYSLIGVVILLFLVGFAVLILISSAARESSYVRLLRLNSRQRADCDLRLPDYKFSDICLGDQLDHLAGRCSDQHTDQQSVRDEEGGLSIYEKKESLSDSVMHSYHCRDLLWHLYPCGQAFHGYL